MPFKETQLTDGLYGHTLNSTQAFSKDGKWIVYDTRNDDTQIGSTGRIEMVHTETGEIRVLYQTEHPSEYGPGVGAATFSPIADRVLFIHGIRNANKNKPYGTARRTGVAIDINKPQQPLFMDARDIVPPFTPGALRGGTHAHTWSSDGQWISFTYNDYLMEQLAKRDSTVKDLRMVGVMMPGKVKVEEDSNLENNSGEMFAAIVTTVTENPKAGSDEIDKAFDECWIGQGHQAIAFQGNIRDISGNTRTEIFIAHLPENLLQAQVGTPLAGSPSTRPNVPEGVSQMRLTHLDKGVEGPRHWLRSTPDGKQILFLSTDSKGHIQLFSVSPENRKVRQVSHQPFSVQGPFNIAPNGTQVTYIADNSIFITDLISGQYQRITAKSSDKERPVGAPNWSPDGKSIAYNHYVEKEGNTFLQIFMVCLY